MDRVRTGDHQAAALRAAALSGDRDPDRRRCRFASAGAKELDGARRGMVVRGAGCPGDRHGRRPRHVRPAIGRAGLAVRRRCGDARPAGVAAVRSRWRRALAAARDGRVDPDLDCGCLALYCRRYPRCSRACRSRRYMRGGRAAKIRSPPPPAITSQAWCISPARRPRLLDGAGAADFLRPGGCRFAFVEARHERGFLRRADAIGLRYAPGPRIDGYNYQHRAIGVDRDLSGGRRVDERTKSRHGWLAVRIEHPRRGRLVLPAAGGAGPSARMAAARQAGARARWPQS